MNTDMISNAIEQYIHTENTDYAILINGPWGVGKTYYARNVIKDLVTLNNSRFAYVSLYGACSCADISDRILSALFPFKDTNAYKVGKALVEIALKRDKIDIALQQLNIDMNGVVLVFDDLERVSSSADFTNILGCLNNYTEHRRVKTIIICNEDAIQDEQYQTTKEKIIRFTYLYKPDAIAIINTFIEQSEQTAPDVHSALSRNRDYLGLIAFIKDANMRTLQTITESLRVAMGYLQRGSYPTDHFDRFVDAILRCFVGLHYEINGGKETRGAVKHFCEEPPSLISLKFRQRNGSPDDIPNRDIYAERFYREYCPDDSNPFVSKSACDIAFDGIGSAVDLNNECASFIDERYSTDKAMNLLSNYWGMNDADFDDAVNEWIRRLRANEIKNVVLLLRVISYLDYFIDQGVVVDINKQELRGNGIKSLQAIAAEMPEDFVASVDSPFGVRTLPSQTGVSKTLLGEVEKLAETFRTEVTKREARAAWERIIRSDNESCFYEVFGLSSKWALSEFFPLLDTTEFVESFTTMSSNLIGHFGGLLKARYGSGNGRLLDVECQPLESLGEHLGENLITARPGEKRTLHMLACQRLRDDISNVLSSHKPARG
jgi:DNA polymerase III delta prime subunit